MKIKLVKKNNIHNHITNKSEALTRSYTDVIFHLYK